MFGQTPNIWSKINYLAKNIIFGQIKYVAKNRMLGQKSNTW